MRRPRFSHFEFWAPYLPFKSGRFVRYIRHFLYFWGTRLILFGYFLEQSASLNEPHHLASYLYEISNLFNQFYEDEKLSEITDDVHISSKLFITNLFLTTSKNVMMCLGITPVNKM